jgi:hypothetical protein
MKDLPSHPNLPWVFALQALIDISSIEIHGTHHAHQTTVAATPIGMLLHLSFLES